MKLRFWKKRNPQPDSVSPAAPQVDLSLRANGKTYIDYYGRSKQIVRRVESSSSSVIGIAGVRGAGKSSMALNALNGLKEKGYFTTLIPSPTAYDPKDFLLTIYQSICIEVDKSILNKSKSIATLEQVGLNETRNSRRKKYILLSVCFFLFSVLSWYLFDKFLVKKFRNSLNSNLNILENAPSFVDSITKQEYYKLYAYENYPAANLNFDYGEPDSYGRRILSKGKYDMLVSKLKNKIEDIDKNPSRYGSLNLIEDSYLLLMYALIFFIFSVVSYIIIYVISNKNIINRIKDPKLIGLYKLTLDKMNWLSYQTKLSSSQDSGINISYFNSKKSKGVTLEDRPLSLPGLTANFNEYIKQVSEVFNDKVIICIDELDKIGNVEQINELLKGVKGVLGMSNTYFILTVSEDALAKFSIRFRNERDLLESSFEEIYLLDTADYKLATSIIAESQSNTSASQSNETFEKNCLIIWIFSRGIPREIKRSIIELNNCIENINLYLTEPIKIWALLMQFLLDDMKSWTLLMNSVTNERDACAFLTVLETLAIDKSGEKDFTDHLQKYVDLCKQSKLILNRINYNNSGSSETSQPQGDDKRIKRAALEVLVSALSYPLVCKAGDLQEAINSASELQNIANIIPYNLTFASNNIFTLHLIKVFRT